MPKRILVTTTLTTRGELEVPDPIWDQGDAAIKGYIRSSKSTVQAQRHDIPEKWPGEYRGPVSLVAVEYELLR